MLLNYNTYKYFVNRKNVALQCILQIRDSFVRPDNILNCIWLSFRGNKWSLTVTGSANTN